MRTNSPKTDQRPVVFFRDCVLDFLDHGWGRGARKWTMMGGRRSARQLLREFSRGVTCLQFWTHTTHGHHSESLADPSNGGMLHRVTSRQHRNMNGLRWPIALSYPREPNPEPDCWQIVYAGAKRSHAMPLDKFTSSCKAAMSRGPPATVLDTSVDFPVFCNFWLAA